MVYNPGGYKPRAHHLKGTHKAHARVDGVIGVPACLCDGSTEESKRARGIKANERNDTPTHLMYRGWERVGADDGLWIEVTFE